MKNLFLYSLDSFGQGTVEMYYFSQADVYQTSKIRLS